MAPLAYYLLASRMIFSLYIRFRIFRHPGEKILGQRCHSMTWRGLTMESPPRYYSRVGHVGRR